jgi:hypothetical protein
MAVITGIQMSSKAMLRPGAEISMLVAVLLALALATTSQPPLADCKLGAAPRAPMADGHQPTADWRAVEQRLAGVQVSRE